MKQFESFEVSVTVFWICQNGLKLARCAQLILLCSQIDSKQFADSLFSKEKIVICF